MSVRNFALAIGLAALGLTASYAAENPAAESGAAAATAPLPQDCGKGMARHDHSAERGMPTPMSAKCAMAPDKTAAKTTATAKPGHNHAKFHKLM